jgi:hypothetical protein
LNAIQKYFHLGQLARSFKVTRMHICIYYSPIFTGTASKRRVVKMPVPDVGSNCRWPGKRLAAERTRVTLRCLIQLLLLHCNKSQHILNIPVHGETHPAVQNLHKHTPDLKHYLKFQLSLSSVCAYKGL